MVTEAASVAIVAPVASYIAATNPQMPAWQRIFLYSTAVACLAVDGWLLAKWMEES